MEDTVDHGLSAEELKLAEERQKDGPAGATVSTNVGKDVYVKVDIRAIGLALELQWSGLREWSVRVSMTKLERRD